MLVSDAIVQVVNHLAVGNVRKATKYLAPTLTVKASRRHKMRARAAFSEILLTIGRPNYAEREFIKAARKAGEPFPIKRVQLKLWPKVR